MKKKIGIYTGNLSIGGQEKMTIEFLKLLSPEKYDIELFIEEDKGQENIYEKDIPKYVKYRFLISEKFMKTLSKQKKSKNPIIKGIYSINLMRKKRKAILEFKKRIKDIDIIIDYNMGLLRNMHLLDLKDKKIIGWSHAGKGEKLKNKKKDQNMNLYTHIVVINEKMREGYEKNYRNKKVKKITNFIDEKNIEKKSRSIPEENLGQYILCVGSLTENKNHRELIIAFEQFIKLFKVDINLVIIGEGKEEINLKKLIKNLKMDQNIYLLGRKENPYKYMKACEVFVHPSINEGFPVVLMEVMSLGKTIVCKTNSGNCEVLKNGESGILINNIIEEFPEVLIKIISNKEFQKKLEIKSMNRAKDFSKEVMKKKIEEFIDQL